MPNFTNVTLQCLVLVYSLCLLAYSGFACAMVDDIQLVRAEAARAANVLRIFRLRRIIPPWRTFLINRTRGSYPHKSATVKKGPSFQLLVEYLEIKHIVYVMKGGRVIMHSGLPLSTFRHMS